MRKRVILCVDDEEIILSSLKTQLKEKFGDLFRYEVADNAIDAFEIIEELKTEGSDIIIIVSDWLMPGIKGDEFLCRIHRMYPHIINVMLTGQADEQAIDRARQEANLLHCILKPWSEQELTNTIQMALDLLQSRPQS
ncbi:MAG: response regulator [Candidatus Delongbacteria bacterium]|nr:response regulator [Candidatus Delongbacteria bacterium]